MTAALPRRPAASGDVVAAFDVDGTLTSSDSMVPFLERLAGRTKLLLGIGRQPLRVADSVVRRDRDRLKAVAVRAAYAGREVAAVEALGREYATVIESTMLRDDTLSRLRWHQSEGHWVVFVSASLGAYLHPLGVSLGVDGVICTEALVGADGRYSGEMVGANCRGPEKERRLREWLNANELGGATLWAYGDSAGDRELLLAAHHRTNVKGRTISETPESTA
ncbi:MAG: HAD-IB family hydrolase [Ilumatobacteraceae bacterium]